jgi:hypothetical protein
MGSSQGWPSHFLPHGMTNLSQIRKRPLAADAPANAGATGEIDIAGCATIAYSSEQPDHPIEHLLDDNSGLGATRWISARPNTIEHILVEFDRPQAMSRSSTRSRRQSENAPRRCAWRSRRMAAARIVKSWFKNTISVPGERLTSARNSASIAARSATSVSRSFRTRTGPAQRR